MFLNAAQKRKKEIRNAQFISPIDNQFSVSKLKVEIAVEQYKNFSKWLIKSILI